NICSNHGVGGQGDIATPGVRPGNGAYASRISGRRVQLHRKGAAAKRAGNKVILEWVENEGAHLGKRQADAVLRPVLTEVFRTEDARVRAHVEHKRLGSWLNYQGSSGQAW